ncbi:MAG: hypothetical protein WBB57_03265 [Mycobacterium sp.]
MVVVDSALASVEVWWWVPFGVALGVFLVVVQPLFSISRLSGPQARVRSLMLVWPLLFQSATA